MSAVSASTGWIGGPLDEWGGGLLCYRGHLGSSRSVFGVVVLVVDVLCCYCERFFRSVKRSFCLMGAEVGRVYLFFRLR